MNNAERRQSRMTIAEWQCNDDGGGAVERAVDVVCSFGCPEQSGDEDPIRGQLWQECDTSHAGLRLMLVKAGSGTRLLLDK